MTLVQLEYVVALDNFRHFGKAAEHCHVTQPTLSMQINKLEDQLGVTLFDRDAHPVEPTTVGKRVITQARIILQQSRRIEDIIDEEKGSLTGELRIGIIPTIAPYLVHLFLGSLRKQYKGLSIWIEELLTNQIIEKIRHHQLDIGIAALPIDDPSISTISLYKEPFVAYMQPGHALAKKEDLSVTDVKNEDIWLLSEGHCFRAQVMDLCSLDSVAGPGFHYESGSLESIVKLVRKYGGITLIPQLAVSLGEGENAVIREFSEPVPYREIALLIHKNFTRLNTLKALEDEILSNIPPPIHVNS